MAAMIRKFVPLYISTLRRVLKAAEHHCSRLERRTLPPIVEIDGVRLLTQAQRISDQIARRIASKTYDFADRLLLRKYLRNGDYFVELGTGCGLTAMVAKQVVGSSGHVVTLEADSGILDVARRNFSMNPYSIESRYGAAISDAIANQVYFNSSTHFWDSSIVSAGTTSPSSLKVPGVFPPDLLRPGFSRYALLCDVEGHETELLKNRLILEPFDLLIVEVHNFGWPQKANGEHIATFFGTIASMQFQLVESIGHSWVWQRDRAKSIDFTREDMSNSREGTRSGFRK